MDEVLELNFNVQNADEASMEEIFVLGDPQ